jgi:hypothetical protein
MQGHAPGEALSMPSAGPTMGHRREVAMDDAAETRDPNHPDHEPGAAEIVAPREPMPGAPDGEAPDLDEIESGEGPGQSPGE